MTYLFGPFRRSMDFRSRATRRELWAFTLSFVILQVGIFLGSAALSAFVYPMIEANRDPLFFWAMRSMAIVAILFALPMLAVQVRRLHDLGRSGWFVLLHALPLVGSLILTVMLLLPGSRESNAYGPDPRAGGSELASVFN
jgi:uncharacterized membrane protein YhaH (DUF805 family)